MPLYKLNVQAPYPRTSHFREADILFTAKDDAQAEKISEEIRERVGGKDATLPAPPRRI